VRWTTVELDSAVDDDDDVGWRECLEVATVAERGQLLYTRHPFNATLKHLLPQTQAVKDCRGFDFRHLCFLAGRLHIVFSLFYISGGLGNNVVVLSV